MVNIEIEEGFRRACPGFRGVAISADIVNSEPDDALWCEIDSRVAAYREAYTVDSVKDIDAIRATRDAYRALGKDPSRYRPSAEALCRRVLRGMQLYRVSTVVDLVNLVSMETGYSIGGFDADKIVGDRLVLGVGRDGEPYEGIGRGPLNIASLPVYRDGAGGIGTPTSDNERTKIDLATSHLLLIVNSYGATSPDDAAEELEALLLKYASASNIDKVKFR
ncbi:MAG TPA: hypothetical protein IAA93_07910 [Candidatus Avibacteroides avistercoris]|uniref:B3/B4 tRNA-binding domain-containing protein n=1 Tax=Candidatus Avibacteroides avistercoris TaxID=2840690 RepID=A0A9D2ZUN0_9BACT|nr:hypothetical protein [Candidatus Avibacteroides avistercoris]